MGARGPILTLAAVGGLAAVLLAVSAVRTPEPVVDSAPATVAAAPPPTTPPRSTTAAPTREAVYIGRSSGNEVTVAVAVSGADASAYLCDGERIEAWLEGSVSGEQVNLEGRGGARLTATLTDGAALGSLTVAEQQLPFSAAAAGPPAGVYEGRAVVDGQPNRIGWIVLPSGRQVGINNVAGTREPAPELDPDDLDGVEVGGVAVEVQRIGGADQVVPR